MIRLCLVWLCFFKLFIKLQMAFRLQILQRILGISFTMISALYFWTAVGVQANTHGYTPTLLLAYFLCSSLQDFVLISGDEYSKKLGERIQKGYLAAALIRPFPFVAEAIAEALASIVVRAFIAVIFLAVGIWFSSEWADVCSHAPWGHYLLTVVMAFIMGVTCLLSVGFLAFYMTHIWGPWVIFVSFFYFFGGVFFPIDLLDGWLKSLVSWLPFYYMHGFPVLVFLGKIPHDVFWASCMQGVMVYALVWTVTMILWHRGLKRFEAVGQ